MPSHEAVASPLGLGKDPLQSLPGSQILRQFAQWLEGPLKIGSIEAVTMTPGNTDGVEHVLVASRKHLEKDQVFRTCKRQPDAEEPMILSPLKRDLFKRKGCGDQVDLEKASAKTQRARRL